MYSQKTSPKDYGYKHFITVQKKDTINFIVRSRSKGRLQKKPVFIFIQDTLPSPLITHDGKSHFPPYPFSSKILEEEYHILTISKPGLPVISLFEDLGKQYRYIDKLTGQPPKEYLQNNNLEYYVKNHTAVLKFLRKQDWVDDSKIIVAGHGQQGSSIAIKLAATHSDISHVIYSGGIPYYSKILSEIREKRRYLGLRELKPLIKDTIQETDVVQFEDWAKAMDLKTLSQGNQQKGLLSFSENLNTCFKKLDIPILVSYGARDIVSPYNDLLRIEMIKYNKDNVEFRAYDGLGANYFPFEKGEFYPMLEYWDLVAEDWKKWLSKL
ncbi:alpha/beta hydrolase family protein [Aquimarina mytili]|uniref:Alpha/beta hydrolase n=1 Tax=Aquimarina mytili TaxID=874423 RepID=A0A937D951_9FLAO|nr:alpha/beta hydrolase [Aquimarina mytili]MBL0682153.1 alpha/beta hydrolase [Aquimarina mytili]